MSFGGDSRWHSLSRVFVDGSYADVALACQLEPQFTSVYRLTSDNPGQCDLTIISVTTSLTGAYNCHDISDADEQRAYVTIIGKLYNIFLTVLLIFIYCKSKMTIRRIKLTKYYIM